MSARYQITVRGRVSPATLLALGQRCIDVVPASTVLSGVSTGGVDLSALFAWLTGRGVDVVAIRRLTGVLAPPRLAASAAAG